MDKRKSKKCKFSQCGKPFIPFKTTQAVCAWSIPCALGYAEEKRKKKFRVETYRMKRERNLKDKRYQLRLAQSAFNAFIRERDKYQPCPGCGRPNVEVSLTDGWKVGGAWDCGHFLTIGAHPELRFEELNAHKQCKSCNGGSGNFTRKNYTVGKEYRENLIQRIGLEKVEWLEGPHEAKNYTLDQIIEIKELYPAKLKDLQRERAA